MALIKCDECGKDYWEGAEKCPYCAKPNGLKTMGNAINQTMVNNSVATQTIIVERYKGVWSAGRLAIGVISILLFFLVSFQSCVAGLNNSILNNGSTSGSNGFAFSVFILIAGIVGICTRNSKGKLGAEITSSLYCVASIITSGTGDTFGDLPIWGIFSFCFGLVFFISALKTKKDN